MAWWKTAASPLLTHWRYYSLVQNHQCVNWRFQKRFSKSILPSFTGCMWPWPTVTEHKRTVPREHTRRVCVQGFAGERHGRRCTRRYMAARRQWLCLQASCRHVWTTKSSIHAVWIVIHNTFDQRIKHKNIYKCSSYLSQHNANSRWPSDTLFDQDMHALTYLLWTASPAVDNMRAQSQDINRHKSS